VKLVLLISPSLTEPYCYCREFDEAHEVGKRFVVAHCDAAELLEFVEEALDEVALLVEMLVAVALDFRECPGLC